MKKKYFPNILFFALTFLCSWSQEYKFHHITTIDGLSHNEVRKIVKDSEGFLWFGTQNGLNRYDGYRFKIFKNNPKDSTTIIGDKIYSLAISKNKLWVGTTKGISVLDTETLEVLPTNELTKAVGEGIILHLFSDDSNTIWISTEKDNFIVDAQTYKTDEILPDHNVASIAKGLNNVYWLGTDKGLLQYDSVKNEILKTYDLGSFSAYSLDQVHTNAYGEIWVTLGSDIFRYQSERDRFVKVFTSRSVNAIAEDKDGSVLFGSYGEGLIKYNRVTGVYETVLADPENHFTLSSNDVYDVYVDEENIVWVGTQEGLDLYDFSRHKFSNLMHLPEDDNSLRSSFVQTLFRDSSGTFWVGTREGIDQLHFDENYTNLKVVHYQIREKGFDALNNDYITCIYQDSKNRMWIATMNNGLFLFGDGQKKNRRFQHYPDEVNSIASNSVRSIMEDHLGRLWFGTGGGLSLLRENNDMDIDFENFSYSKYDTNSLPLNDIYSVFQDSKKRIWIGMNHGGVSLLREQGNGIGFLRFENDPANNNSLSNNEVFVIYEDSKKQIWFGTSGGGLNLLHEDGSSANNSGYYFKRYTEIEGLSDNEVNAILEDDSGNLWVATNKGLSQFNLEDEYFTNYTTYDGVVKGKFRKNARWKTKDGILFFGGAAGINFFNPNNFRKNEIASKPVFTTLTIDGKEIKTGQELDGSVVLKKSLGPKASVILPAKDNRFDIEFSALSYTSPYRNKYMFKLEGVDENWNIVSGKNPHASYSKLPSGNYRFYLKYSNNDGVLSEEPIYLNIVVKGNFFEGKAFKVLAVFLFLSTMILAILLFKKYKNNPRLRKLNHKIKSKLKPIDPEVEKELLGEVAALDNLMTTKQLYLDAELGLNQLAEKMNVSANHLSMLLNDYIGKNFYDYINHFRVEEVKKRLKDPSYSKQTISSIGGDCGFNSKSAFNRIFKNSTGKTPSQYQNQM